MGTQDLDNGELWSYPNLQISYFSQNFEIDLSKTVEEEIMKVVLSDDEKYKIDIYCDNLNLNKHAPTDSLSGGQKRRIARIYRLGQLVSSRSRARAIEDDAE